MTSEIAVMVPVIAGVVYLAISLVRRARPYSTGAAGAFLAGIFALLLGLGRPVEDASSWAILAAAIVLLVGGLLVGRRGPRRGATRPAAPD